MFVCRNLSNSGLSVLDLFSIVVFSITLGAPAIGYAEILSPARAFGGLLSELNGDIFWAPASGFTSDNTWPNIFGDEARSVFGPIPPITCMGSSSSHFEAEVSGNPVRLLKKPGGGFLFQHRNLQGAVVGESEIVEKCDKPSLANTRGHPCDIGSRINRLNNQSSKNVDWAVLCRKNELGPALTSEDDYWLTDNPYFALLGVIGFNPGSGEVVFFDGTNLDRGRKRISTFKWAQTFPPPGGSGYDDHAGRAKAYKTYFHTGQIQCETCHDNKEPWILTPHLKYAGFGYRDSTREARFGKANSLPLVQPRSDNSPYRVIGRRFSKNADLTSKTFRDPTGSCTYCHTLTTGWTGKVLAYDAVGKINESKKYKYVFQKVLDARTDWAKLKGNTHPWMVPWLGPNVKPNIDPGLKPSEINEKNWQRIADCINETSLEDCHYKPVYTSCPEPESLEIDCSKEDELNNRCARLADPFGPSEMVAITTLLDKEVDPAFSYNMKTKLSWSYLNGLGGVPQRDDVRFNLAITEVEMPDNESDPAIKDYPSLQAAADPYFSDPVKKGRIHYCDLGGKREKTCHIFNPEKGELFINNISYSGHLRNTTPEPTTTPRQYSVVVPTQCNKRYLARLVPKRFCFDRSGVLASKVDHVKYFDVKCNAN